MHQDSDEFSYPGPTVSIEEYDPWIQIADLLQMAIYVSLRTDMNRADFMDLASQAWASGR